MSRKPKKGYFVRGQFVAEGSELDLEFKRELKFGLEGPSRTELKRESTELQELGTQLLTLRADLMADLKLTDKLKDALAEAKRITNFEGKRRQMQFIGKQMRLLSAETIDAVRAAIAALLQVHLDAMHQHSPPESVHALDLEGLRQPEISFWSAWEGDALLGCGALKELNPTQAELKSMRTAAAHLRKGVAARLLARATSSQATRAVASTPPTAAVSPFRATPSPFSKSMVIYSGISGASSGLTVRE